VFFFSKTGTQKNLVVEKFFWMPIVCNAELNLFQYRSGLLIPQRGASIFASWKSIGVILFSSSASPGWGVVTTYTGHIYCSNLIFNTNHQVVDIYLRLFFNLFSNSFPIIGIFIFLLTLIFIFSGVLLYEVSTFNKNLFSSNLCKNRCRLFRHLRECCHFLVHVGWSIAREVINKWTGSIATDFFFITPWGEVSPKQ